MASQDQGDLRDGSRHGIGRWGVPLAHIPALSNWMLDQLAPEKYDPAFRGQRLTTTYFDTDKLDLRKNRSQHANYITLRLRHYREGKQEAYALSCKTPDEKYRVEVPKLLALAIDKPNADITAIIRGVIPSHLGWLLLEVSHERDLLPVVRIHTRRYAVESDSDRYTLDVDVQTDTGKVLPYAVLEYKSVSADALPDSSLALQQVRPSKLSKFLWATEV